MNTGGSLLSGIGIGAGLMYVLATARCGAAGPGAKDGLGTMADQFRAPDASPRW